MKKAPFALITAATLISAGCTWVKPTEEGQQVMVLSAKEVKDCIDIGKTTASLKHEVAGIERSQSKVKWELLTLGRNSAVNMGGNAIIPISEIKDGKQTFEVYKCTGKSFEDYRFPPLSEPGK